MSDIPKKFKAPFPLRLLATFIIYILLVLIFVSLVFVLSFELIFFYIFFHILSAIAAIALINKVDTPSFKLIWIVIMLTLPLLGGMFYLVFAFHGFPFKRKKLKKIEEEYQSFIPQSQIFMDHLDTWHPTAYSQSRYIRHASGYPMYTNTKVSYFSPGESVYTMMLEQLQKAEKFIFIEFFILGEGVMWDGIEKILVEKIKSGVTVKILFDDVGTLSRQSKRFLPRLRSLGIDIRVFNPIKPSLNTFINNRDHRKIVAIDGKTAIMGGFNIGDEYINVNSPHGHWMDCGVLLEGEAALSSTVMFLSTWLFVTGERLHLQPPELDSYDNEEGLSQKYGFIQPYCDGPLNERNCAEGIYLKLISNANHYLYITSPYLIIDNNVLQVLANAVRSGVDVRIITPKIGDKWYVHNTTKSHYNYLLSQGVKIYEYTPGFMHSKMFLCDDLTAIVGSINLDYRSFYFHFECAVWMHNAPAIKDIKKDFEHILSVSEEITLEKWKKRNFATKALHAFLHLFSPLM